MPSDTEATPGSKCTLTVGIQITFAPLSAASLASS